jgi:Panthothenate synthetase
MGNLHEGHLSLVDASNKFTGVTLTSIFVNPLQFAPNEDLEIYPRSLEEDIKKLRIRSCDAVFCPELNLSKNIVKLSANPLLAKKLCGISRPHFFDGVISILNYFFRLIHPANTFFGLKDYQQYLIVKDFLQNSDIQTIIHGVPIIREIDGLAMSSRNNLLSMDQRKIAKNIYLTLNDIALGIRTDTFENLRIKSIKKLTNYGFEVDYLSFCNSTSLKKISKFEPIL